jgi:tRNA U38,U39,U40 pseudouridine synthase TruA
MNEEFDALKKNTWRLVPSHEGKNIIDCRWIYKIKRKSDGSINIYKARLVAKSFKQRYVIDMRILSVMLLKLQLFALSWQFQFSRDGVCDG